MGAASDALGLGALARSTALTAIALPVICAVEGDSRMAYGRWGQSSSWRGLTQWVQIMSNQRLQFPGALNTAVSGNNTTQILARMPASILAAKAAGASCMWMRLGINDRIAGFTFATTMANVQAIIALCQAAGLIVFIFVDTSCAAVGFTTNQLSATQSAIQQRTRFAYRQLQNSQAGVEIFDISAAYDDPLSTLNYNLATMVADGTHDQISGSMAAALVAMPTVNRRWPSVPFSPFTSNSQQFDATNNPNGCLTANPMVDGTTGVINASAPNATGQVATGWNFGANTAGGVLTAALSKVTKADGTTWQQAAISGTVGSGLTLTNYPLGVARLWFYQTISLTNAPIGSKVQIVGQMEYDSGNANISSLIFGSEASYTGATQYNELGYRGQTVANAMVMPAGPLSLPPMGNEPMIIPPTTTVHIMRVGVEIEVPSATVAMTFRFRGTGARIVP